MEYCYTHLEEFITNLYQSLSILSHKQLNMFDIAKKLNVKLYFFDAESECHKFGGKYRIFIDNRQSKQKQWQDFGHELGHVLCHAGHQLKMNHMFLKYQEWKANNFMYHFCVPTFMLCQLKEVNVHNVMDLFNVEYEFACKRLASFSFKKHIIKTHCERSYQIGFIPKIQN